MKPVQNQLSPSEAKKTSVNAAVRATQMAERLGRRSTDHAVPPARPQVPFRARKGTLRKRSLPMPEQAARAAEVSLAHRIRAHMPRGHLSVTLTDNRYTMISVKRDEKRGPEYRVRLHHMFADANPRITRALALYIGKNDSSASRTLGEFIDSRQACIRPKTSRRPRLTTEGEVHDLQAIFDELNTAYFGGKIRARITWGPRLGAPRRRNSIKMGSYSVEEKLIRIHRALDREFVPRFFLGWIVYHEMLHQVHGAEVVNGRRRFHTKAFLEDEARYDFYADARAWERAHLDALLTY